MKRAFCLLLFFFCACMMPQSVNASGNFAGIVTDSVTSLPISGALIVATKGNQQRQSTNTAVNGTYTMTNLNQANFTVIASEPGYQTQAVGARIINNETTIVNFALVPTGGTISGTVKDEASVGIVGATVEIFQGQTLITTVTTGGGGAYTAPNLEPGVYNVVASASGFQTQSQGATVQAAVVTTIDFVLIANPGSITGTVIDAATRSPIEGALVEVFDGSVVVGFVDTDGNGSYTILGLAPGSYAVTASADGYQSKTVGASVTSNAATTVDFALQVPPGTIAGRVTDAISGDPIPGASINVYQGVTLIASVLTDPNGQYSISEFAPGNYLVSANANLHQQQIKAGTVTSNATTTIDFSLSANPGTISGIVTDAITTNPIEGATIKVYSGQLYITSTLTATDGTYLIQNLSPGDYIVTASKIDYQTQAVGASVTAGGTTTVNFALQTPPGTISGKVTNDANGSAIPGASILVLQNFVIIGSAVTDANGNYSIIDLAPGNYSVIANAPNFSIAVVGATVTGNNTTVVNFALKADPGKIFGRVTDASTTFPIPGASIQVRNSFIVIATAITDENGDYNFPNLPPNTYTVTASAPDYQRQVEIATVNTNQVTVVNFALSSTGGNISGTVTDAVTTNPIPDATVAVFQGSTLIDFALTDVNGDYFIPDLAPGNYTVLVIAQGYRTAFSSETVVAGMTTTADFALDLAPGTIAGTVTDRCTGGPVPGALILVTDGSTVVDFGLTDPNGIYSINTVPPGNYTVTATVHNFLIGSSSATVTANTTTTVNFILTPTLLPPTTISGCALPNEFLTQIDLIHIISWTASPSECVTGYQIFRNGVQIALVPSSQLEYKDHNRNYQTDVYTVKAVNSFGMITDAVSVTIDNTNKCPKRS